MPRPLTQEASVAGQESGRGQRGLWWAVRSGKWRVAPGHTRGVAAPCPMWSGQEVEWR